MEEKKIYTFAQICSKIGSGATPKGGKESYLGGDTSLIRSQNVLDFGFQYNGLALINENQARTLDNVSVIENDVLLNITGDSVARCCKVPTDVLPARVNQHVAIIRGKNDIVKPDYILYYLQYKKQYLLSLSQGGATRNALTKKMIEDTEIPLPSISEQEAIVNILRSLDSKIELNRRINDNLEQQAQALFRSWFVDFEPFRGGRFIESELGMIPEGWRVVELGEVTTLEKEKVKSRTDVKVLSPINTGELVQSEEYFTKQVFSDSIDKYIIVRPNAFAYNPARVNIGSIGRNTFEFDGCVSPVYVVFTCEKGYHFFIDMYRQLQPFKNEIITRSIGGVRQTLNYTDFALIKVVYPPKKVVQEFNVLFEHLLMTQNYYSRENRNLAELRHTLLPKLMSGELKISDPIF